jgi:hypothetical protein
MSQSTQSKVSNIKFIDQMLEDFAGDEYDDVAVSYSDPSYERKHYSADEDAINIDDLY